MKRYLLVLFVSISINNYCISQVNILWQSRYTSSGANSDKAEDMVIDASGNVYVTGVGRGASNTFDFITIKYDANGNQLWKSEYNGTGSGLDQAHAIVIDAGFVYVTGLSYGGASTGYDYATLKYDINTGAAVWASASRYNNASVSAGTDEAFDIDIDNAGNVYVTGSSDSPILNMKTNSAATTLKYNSAGVQQWVMRYEGGGAGYDAAYDIRVERVAGIVYITGTADIASYPSYNSNYLLIKYNTLGTQQWVASYNGPDSKNDEAKKMTFDAAGNVYVTGLSQNLVVTNYDIATVKYNSSGVQQWVKRYNGTGNDDDRGTDIKLDAVGNIYVTGRSVGAASAAKDIITIKYNNAGIEKWVRRYDNGGANPSDEGKSLAIDNSGSIYVSGYSNRNGSGNDFTTIKYDSLGVLQWITFYSGPANNADQSTAMALDNIGNVYVAGVSKGSGSAEDFLTIKYCQLKTIAGNDTSICIGASVNLNATTAGAISYSWTPNNGSLSNTTIANPVATPTVTTSYIVSVANSNGCVDLDTVVITVGQYPFDTITANGPKTFCIGDSVMLTATSGANYQWSSSPNDTLQSITVFTSGTYSVTLTSPIGCVSTGTALVVVNAASVNANASDTTCSNVSINLSATGGVTYDWTPGNTLNDSTTATPIASPTVTTTYIVIGTDANGCKDADTTTITVLQAPQAPMITSLGNNTLSCVGTYTTYQWFLNGSAISGANGPTHVMTQYGSYTLKVTEATGCSAMSLPYVGIEEVGKVALLNIYPNPFSSNINIEIELLLETNLNYVVMDINGKQLYKESYENYSGKYRKQIDLTQYSSGMYFMQIMVDETIVTKKLVKQ